MASKSMVAFLMVNLALFALVSAVPRATNSCPDLNVCANIAESLRGVLVFGSQSGSQCCRRLVSVVNGGAANCLCSILRTPSPGLEPSQGLGNIIGTALGLVHNVVGGVLGGVLGGFLGGFPGDLPLNIVDEELRAIFNVCGLDTPADYDCPRLY